MTTEPYTYIGNELEIFAHATNWKRYFGRRIHARLGPSVLEVGAGLGETTRHLAVGRHREWLCLEPDAGFCDKIRAHISSGQLPAFCSVCHGTTQTLEGQPRKFDTILYIDVLEHIQDDCAELRRASSLLVDQGEVIVLAPAHDFLFSPLDRRVGHCRRYDRKSLARACPAELTLKRMEYLDSAGMAASLANRWLLRQPTPTMRQIAFWDKVLVRMSEFVDPVSAYRLGKSILAVMQKTPAPTDRTSRTS